MNSDTSKDARPAREVSTRTRPDVPSSFQYSGSYGKHEVKITGTSALFAGIAIAAFGAFVLLILLS